MGSRLMQMSEVEREEILSQRAEERQRIQDKRALQQMVKDQRADGDSVAKAAKRSFLRNSQPSDSPISLQVSTLLEGLRKKRAGNWMN